eukprot:gene11975-16028_t
MDIDLELDNLIHDNTSGSLVHNSQQRTDINTLLDDFDQVNGMNAELIKELKHLGAIKLKNGDYDEAIAIYEQLLSFTYDEDNNTLKDTNDLNDSEITLSKRNKLQRLTILNTLSRILLLTKCFELAVKYLEEILVLSCELYGAEHLNTVYAMIALAGGFRSLKTNNNTINYNLNSGATHLIEAEQLYLQSLRILHNIYGESAVNIDIAKVLVRLGLTIEAQQISSLVRIDDESSRYDEVKQIYDDALFIYRAIYGENHITTADTLICVAALATRMNQIDVAIVRYEQALSILLTICDVNHSRITLILESLLLLFKKQSIILKEEKFVAESNVKLKSVELRCVGSPIISGYFHKLSSSNVADPTLHSNNNLLENQSYIPVFVAIYPSKINQYQYKSDQEDVYIDNDNNNDNNNTNNNKSVIKFHSYNSVSIIWAEVMNDDKSLEGLEPLMNNQKLNRRIPLLREMSGGITGIFRPFSERFGITSKINDNYDQSGGKIVNNELSFPSAKIICHTIFEKNRNNNNTKLKYDNTHNNNDIELFNIYDSENGQGNRLNRSELFSLKLFDTKFDNSDIISSKENNHMSLSRKNSASKKEILQLFTHNRDELQSWVDAIALWRNSSSTGTTASVVESIVSNEPTDRIKSENKTKDVESIESVLNSIQIDNNNQTNITSI